MANTGVNTTTDRQAAIRITASGCLTQALADLLATNMVIEFPESVGADGRIDVLSSSALDQIATQLTNSATFQTLLTEALASGTTQQQIVDLLVVDPAFIDLVNGSSTPNADKQVLCGTETVSVNASLQAVFAVEASSAFALAYSFFAVGAVNVTGDSIASQTNNGFVLSLPNATAGDAVSIHWIRCLV